MKKGTTLPNFEVEPASVEHAELLAQIRVAAMRESLEAVGRFDFEIAKQRFLSSFAPEDTQMLLISSEIVGFYELTENEGYLYLKHLYLLPKVQGSGVGGKVISSLKQRAAEVGLPLRLGALRDSRSNDFYQRHGFTKTHEDEWDIYYQWGHGAKHRKYRRD